MTHSLLSLSLSLHITQTPKIQSNKKQVKLIPLTTIMPSFSTKIYVTKKQNKKKERKKERQDKKEKERTRLRHKSLLQDYEDLQKETNGMRIKLQVAKQKKSMLAAEVRFLRQRYTYLMKNPSSKPQPTQDVSQLRNLKTEASIPSKSWSYRRKESTLRPPIASHLRTKQKNSNGVDFVLQKPARMFDLNQSARSLCKQDASFLSSAPSLELNHKNRIYAGKEATKNSVAPFFDLNQISTEEEELLGNVEPLRIDKSKRLTQIDEDEEQRNDIKLSVCRNIGSGSNRTGKRKISWQDQMALRV
ncbi:hypothetical protein Lalb_Chr08g0234281 [Lupinus albus]|uniref:Uncharacterized protein n=1 Tax=Lupinus albus TaxID=3870 RepID=A0A6A4Q2J0_LUPAL|nr:hypothetical protein Lalb_Chr08g0234281 [Lupinus albus]